MSFQAKLARRKSTTQQASTSAATRAKAQIRRNVLLAIGADQAHVFDGFAGGGHMHHEVWHEAASYTGCDMRFFHDSRMAFVGDNRRVMRAIDLTRFNIFDFDAYGSPWDQVIIMIARRQLSPGARLGLVLTEGTGLKMKFGGASIGLAELAGIRLTMPGMGSERDRIVERAIIRTARQLHADITQRWEARGKVGSAMRYIGLVLEGVTSASASS